MIETKITCDGPSCNKQKGLTNHWYVVNFDPNVRVVTTFYVDPWSLASDADKNQGKHVCSHDCAHKLLEIWMNEVEGNQK